MCLDELEKGKKLGSWEDFYFFIIFIFVLILTYSFQTGGAGMEGVGQGYH